MTRFLPDKIILTYDAAKAFTARTFACSRLNSGQRGLSSDKDERNENLKGMVQIVSSALSGRIRWVYRGLFASGASPGTVYKMQSPRLRELKLK